MSDIKEATRYIRKMYRRILKISPSIHLYKGKVSYMFFEEWVGKCEDSESIFRLKILCRLLYKVCNRYPKSAYTLVENLIDELPLAIDQNDVELFWIHGYFNAILDIGGKLYDTA